MRIRWLSLIYYIVTCTCKWRSINVIPLLLGWITCIWLHFSWEIKKKDYGVSYCAKRCLYWLHWVGFSYISIESTYFIIKKNDMKEIIIFDLKNKCIYFHDLDSKWNIIIFFQYKKHSLTFFCKLQKLLFLKRQPHLVILIYSFQVGPYIFWNIKQNQLLNHEKHSSIILYSYQLSKCKFIEKLEGTYCHFCFCWKKVEMY